MLQQIITSLKKGWTDRQQTKQKIEEILKNPITEKSIDKARTYRLNYVEQQKYSQTTAKKLDMIVEKAFEEWYVSNNKIPQHQEKQAPLKNLDQQQLTTIKQQFDNIMFPKVSGELISAKGELIGEGEFGEIYSINSTQKRVLKLVKKLSNQNCSLLQRYETMLNEINAFREIGHPNIPKVYQFNPLDDKNYIGAFVMEFREGKEPKEIIWEGTKFNALTWYNYLQQIGSALTAIHKKGFVYRDIKPTNTLLSVSGEATLLDMGLCVKNSESEKTKRDYKVAGSIQYLPPEVLLGRVRHSTSSDTYGFAVLAYELITRNHFLLQKSNYNPLKIAQLRLNSTQVYNEVSSDFRMFGSDNKDLVTVFLKALNPNPKKRYQTVHELTSALSKLTVSYLLKQDLTKESYTFLISAGVDSQKMLPILQKMKQCINGEIAKRRSYKQIAEMMWVYDITKDDDKKRIQDEAKSIILHEKTKDYHHLFLIAGLRYQAIVKTLKQGEPLQRSYAQYLQKYKYVFGWIKNEHAEKHILKTLEKVIELKNDSTVNYEVLQQQNEYLDTILHEINKSQSRRQRREHFEQIKQIQKKTVEQSLAEYKQYIEHISHIDYHEKKRYNQILKNMGFNMVVHTTLVGIMNHQNNCEQFVKEHLPIIRKNLRRLEEVIPSQHIDNQYMANYLQIKIP